MNIKNNSNPYLQLLNNNDNVNENKINLDNNLLLEINKNVLKLLEKKIVKKKNNYFKITKTMFTNEILNNYPDFPENKMNLIFSNGNDFFIDIKNKKFPLNKKYFLKFINNIIN